jgi:AraC family transcriptional regulator, regulatory protein of adaptative response / methylated-DNA-[protein]-cysteine methyltransferase
MTRMAHGPVEAGRWEAVMARERVHDDTFVYAVRTTGVFSRPSCPSRWPRPENVEFFDSPEHAIRAGYRS